MRPHPRRPLSVDIATFSLAVVLAATGGARAEQLVSYSYPADSDRVGFRAPITIHLAAQIEMGSDGDGGGSKVGWGPEATTC